MKTKNILIIICLFCTSAGFAQNKLFEKYADMDNVTSVYISKAMFQMMGNVVNAGMNFTNLKGKIESLQLVSTEKQNMIAQMKKDFSQLVGNSQYQELMRVKDEKNRVNFFASMQGDLIKELIMLVNDEDSFTAIQLVGNFTLQDVQDIVKQK